MQRQPCRVAVSQVAGAQIAWRESDPSFIHHEFHTHRKFVNRVLEAAAQEHKIRPAKAIVRIAPQQVVAIDIRTAQCRIEIERHRISRRYKRGRIQESQTEAAFEIPGDCGTRLCVYILQATVRTVELLRV